MKKTMILETLLVAAALAAPHAKAAPVSLQGATITATYNGSASDMLGQDGGYAPGSNTTAYDPGVTGIEFMSGDYLFFFDFSDTGVLTVTNNMSVPTGTYRAAFDFGSSLSQPITSFSLLDASAVGGVPAFSVLSDHSIELDFSSVTWGADFLSFSAQLGNTPPAAVPEPGSIALVLAGLAGVAATRGLRTRRS
jgi:hypothetical protein